MSDRSKDATIDSGILKALSHPLRQRILLLLNQGVASPSDLAAELDVPLVNVSYHVKVLEEHGAIELVRTGQVRGALEHFYRATVRPRIEDPNHWASLPASVREALFDQTLQQIWQHVVTAASNDGFEDPETHISWTLLELDDQAYAELGEALAALVDRATDLHAEAAARLGALPEEERESHATELAIMHFHHQRGPKGAAGRPHRRRAKSKARA